LIEVALKRKDTQWKCLSTYINYLLHIDKPGYGLYISINLDTALLWLRIIMFEIGYNQSPSIILEENTQSLQQSLSAKVRSCPQVEPSNLTASFIV